MIDFLGTLWQVFGGAARYVVWVDDGWAAYSIRDVLSANGVRIRCLSISGPFINFYASRRDDWKAQAVMNANGIRFGGGRTFKRAPFLPGQGQPGGAPTTNPLGSKTGVTGGDWTAAATAQLAERRARKGR